MRALRAARETWPLPGEFRISRGARTESVVAVAEIEDGPHRGRGECFPYPRYGESVDSVLQQIDEVRSKVQAGLSRQELRHLLPPGAARNAVDCALWDLEAKMAGKRVWELAGLPEPAVVTTAYTLSLDAPAAMAAAAREAADRPLLKLKLGGADDIERVAAVHEAAPAADIIVDANEAWTPDMVIPLSRRLAGLGVTMIEQPLPADADRALAGIDHPVPICADESCHTAVDVPALADRYDIVNVKLDKTGGLTEAIEVVAAARAAGLGLMVGCMVGTSLAMAPATLIAGAARYVDLDGPLLLARDRDPGLRYDGSRLSPPTPEIWG